MQQNDTQALPVKRFFSYLKAYKLAFIVAFIGMVGYSALDTFVISQVQPVIDRSLNNQDYGYLRMAAYLVVPVLFCAAYLTLWAVTH